VLAVVGDSSGAAPGGQEPSKDAPAAEEEKPAPKAEETKPEPKAEEKKPEAPKAEPKQERSAPAPAPKAADSISGAESSGYVTPLVRKMAAEAGVDLSSVTGTGLGGRIRKQDVQQAIDAQKSAAAAPQAPAAAAAPAAPAAPELEASSLRGTEEEMSSMRRTSAAGMLASLQTQAQLTTAVDVARTRIGTLRGREKDACRQRAGAKLTCLPLLSQAAVEGLKMYPKFNAEIDGEMCKSPA